MNNLVKQEKKKSLVEKATNLENFTSRSITKRLNPIYGVIMVVSYTALIVVGTSKFLAKDVVVVDNSDQYGLFKDEIINEIKKQNDRKRDGVVVSSRDNVSIKNEMERLRADIIDQVNKMNLKYISLVNREKEDYSKVINDLAKREPASISTNGKAIPYNTVNNNLLLFKHQKQYKRLKEKLKREEDKQIAKLDLTNPTEVEKLKDIQDSTELALYELNQKLYAKRQLFAKNKYIVLND